MDKHTILEDISKSIEKIKDEYKHIKNKELVSELEIDLLVSKVRYLYEKTIALKYVNKYQLDKRDFSAFSEKINNNDVESLKRVVDLVEEKPAINSDSEETLVETPLAEEIQTETIVEEQNHAIEAAENIEEPSENLVEENKEEIVEVLNEDFELSQISIETKEEIQIEIKQEIKVKEQNNDLNSKLKNQNKTSLYQRFLQIEKQGDLLNKFQQTPITDLKKAIGINERYTFSKTLFKNDMNALMSAIEHLNNMKSFDEALKYISEEFDEKYNWKDSQDEQLLFINTIKRKFV
jgi:hypothetical protein